MRRIATNRKDINVRGFELRHLKVIKAAMAKSDSAGVIRLSDGAAMKWAATQYARILMGEKA